MVAQPPAECAECKVVFETGCGIHVPLASIAIVGGEAAGHVRHHGRCHPPVMGWSVRGARELFISAGVHWDGAGHAVVPRPHGE
jgi:hypothetical protein